jgi:thiol-disulfide isomerase/thioredoxin
LNVSRRDAIWMAPGLALALAAPAKASPARVEPFDGRTWRALQAGLRTPTLVVFSATWCPNCPAVIEDLAQEVREHGFKAQLLAVVIDVAPGEQDAGLMGHSYYRLMDRLLAFSGQAPALRHSVDPTWRGATPFVALLSPGQAPRLVTGAPGEEDLRAWMSPARAR